MLHEHFYKRRILLSILAPLALACVLVAAILLVGGNSGRRVLAVDDATDHVNKPTAPEQVSEHTIDNFNGPFHEVNVFNYPGIAVRLSDTTVTDTANALGNERDISMTLTSGTGGANAEIDTEDGVYGHYQANNLAISEIVWDGNDDDANVINYDGLNYDLTHDGTNDAFKLVVVIIDLDINLGITVYSDEDNYSEVTVPITGPVEDKQLMIPYGEFTPVGAGADFEHVGAIVLTIDGTREELLDVQIDEFKTTAMVFAEKTVKDLDGDTVMPGHTLQYTVTIDNKDDPANLDAPGIVFSDTVPDTLDLDCSSPGDPTTTRGTVSECVPGLGGHFAVDVGDIPDGEIVTITFQATVSTSMPADVTEICNQGWVGSAGGLNLPTDDPEEEGNDNPTCVDLYLDFGDAPDDSPYSYPTILSDNGASHFLGGVRLGECADAEDDGQPTTDADGDDNGDGSPDFGTCTGGDDENGVSFPNALIGDTEATVVVTTSGACNLSAWIDYNRDGDWEDAGEEIFTGEVLGSADDHTLNFNVPAGIATGDTYARFRCATATVDEPTGPADDGEVEDLMVELQPPMDFGDAPDPNYPTLLTNDGARHILTDTVYMGQCVDGETDGQSSDDTSAGTPTYGTCAVANDDEDGVSFPSTLYVGAEGEVDVVVHGGCYLSAWIDFNEDGDWDDANEDIFSDQWRGAGTHNLTFSIPEGDFDGTKHARFRCTTEDNISYDGEADDGEVEDYEVDIEYAYDWGDAPDSYSTLNTSNGARHKLGTSDTALYLGQCADAESDGQPSSGAVDDDNNTGSPVFGTCTGNDDEDGVEFETFYVGATGDVTVTTSAECYLSAWIDFSGNGDWTDDTDEKIFDAEYLSSSGTHHLTFTVPSDAATGDTYARFRCVSTDGTLSYNGEANDGEVEDYGNVEIEDSYDFGDLPSAYNITVLADNGARHLLGAGIFLGDCVDGEDDGLESTGAISDDLEIGNPVFGTCTANDDEDGVTFATPLYVGENAEITVTASAVCNLSAWIDFDGDNNFTGEQIFSDEPLSAGNNGLTFTVPAPLDEKTTYARFRCTTDSGVSYDDSASDGEVEDYEVDVVTLKDYSDEPDSYNTTRGEDGARHELNVAVLHLGDCVDAEGDGQPSDDALADDDNPTTFAYGTCSDDDDEDGVSFTTPLYVGAQVTVAVTATTGETSCNLSAWMDFDGNGSYEGDEEIFDDVPFSTGTRYLSFTVPTTATLGDTYARFRCTIDTDVGPYGLASDGEVEGYRVTIEAIDLGDAPDTYSTTLASDGAYHILTDTVYLGTCVDGEPYSIFNDDGHVGSPVLGTSCTDDEDGVALPSTLYVGDTGEVEVVVYGGCNLSAWMDFNGDGDWAEANEKIITETLSSGTHNLTFTIPTDAVSDTVYARFRCTTDDDVPYYGPASDGEVEDHQVVINHAYDFSDAPDPTYPTDLPDGARHRLGTNDIYLGVCVDGESDGQSSDDAATGTPVFGDCVNDDDEDGVVFTSTLYVGDTTAGVVVTANIACNLSAWIDFDNDGSWTNPGERIFHGTSLNPGGNSLTFAIPTDAVSSTTYARFRCATATIDNPTGEISDGEVEDYQVNLVTPKDFGDAPDPYPTDVISNGARHIISNTTVYMGGCVDSELDGQPSDDTASSPMTFGTCAVVNDDEDGVEFESISLIGDATSEVTVTTSAGCYLNAWMDFNIDGDWDDIGEQIFTDESLVGSGPHKLEFSIPASAKSDNTYARFRCAAHPDDVDEPTGEATNGEVEDHQRYLTAPKDFGDAPAPYPTEVVSDGASHVLTTTVYLGECVDGELDGQPSVGAVDDNDGTDGTPAYGTSCTANSEENGVELPATLYVGDATAPVTVVVEGGCNLSAWMDFNADGDWEDSGEQIFTDESLGDGTHNLSFPIPSTAVSSTTYARFRCTTDTGVSFIYEASDGEVEDYQVTIEHAYDFGDTPEDGPLYYTSTLQYDGARHKLGTNDVYLGNCVDGESDGQPNDAADGDDNNSDGAPVFTSTSPCANDEDGVTFSDLYVGDDAAEVDVEANEPCNLTAWMDFDGDGIWQSDEKIFDGYALGDGTNNLTFAIPTWVVSGTTYARFRCASATVNEPTGPAEDGEVEDYRVAIEYAYDLSDAPSPYPTTVANDGARHRLGVSDDAIYLGQCVDGESDGQPNSDATGDDDNIGPDSPVFITGTLPCDNDEDGVEFGTLYVGDATADVTVTASAPCTLTAWMDFDHSDAWESDEKIFDGYALADGINNLTFPIPVGATAGDTYARFRCASEAVDEPTGEADDGEVEDYQVDLEYALDFGDAPDPDYPTLLTNEGARHQLGVNDIYLGNCVDGEPDGLQSSGATGDDLDTGNPIFTDTLPCADGGDDGVEFPSKLYVGDTQATVVVTANAACTLTAWIDFDVPNDGWDNGDERILYSEQLVVGRNTLFFTVPTGAELGDTYARFRCASDTVDNPTGLADDGEVEDLEVTIYAIDLADEPDSYSTLLASDGASHLLDVASPRLGACVDGEPDGLPSSGATGDDQDSGSPTFGDCAVDGDDEDGVKFTPQWLAVGLTSKVEVTVTNKACTLTAWIDFDQSGDYDATGEALFTGGRHLDPGNHTLTFTVPSSALTDTTYARFRCTTDGAVGPTGQATDGEVESYQVTIEEPYDFGDALEAGTSFTTTLANDGARHRLDSDVYLGSCVDAELDGQPGADADDDDSTTGPFRGNCVGDDDEDGVEIPPVFLIGDTNYVTVTASAPCSLTAWIDFDDSDSWDADERIFTGTSVYEGENGLAFDVPTGLDMGHRYARFRCTTDGVVETTGLASDGEVEDYHISLGPAYDHGDAPDPYPTTFADGGARHVLGDGFPYLGACVDAENPAAPNDDATGDDNDSSSVRWGTCVDGNDEDGVEFLDPLVGGQEVRVIVTATLPGPGQSEHCLLSAWIDFDANGNWTDPDDRIFTDTEVFELLGASHGNELTFTVPMGAEIGDTFARFRCTTEGNVGFGGGTSNGEVEDYQVEIEEVWDFGDTPAPYPTKIISGGAKHRLGNNDVYLGNCVDGEDDGQPSDLGDDDDDTAGSMVWGTCTGDDDEDGVAFTSDLVEGWVATVDVTASKTCTLSAWIDFAGDGSWAQTSDELFPGGETLDAGVNHLTFTVPPGAAVNPTYARFRCTTDGPVDYYYKNASDGEVEDHEVEIVEGMKLGDKVWDDQNGDGIQDVGEPGLPGITVTLHLDGDCGGRVISTTVTDESGHYSFDHLLKTNIYCLQFELPEIGGWVISPQDVGDDDTLDSDVDRDTLQINDIVLTADDLDEDMGLYFVPVGGVTIPVSVPELLLPLLLLAGMVITGTVATVMLKRRRD